MAEPLAWNCNGGRLRREATYVKIDGKSITDLVPLPIDELQAAFAELKLTRWEKEVAGRILLEINNRLETLVRVGLSYLTLDRLASTLSGGESQRIHLTRLLGSNLTNSLYILDEPSIGLHPKDTNQLVKVLKGLRDLGNTVIVVEHEEEIIRNADFIVDIGPLAGVQGGELVRAEPLKTFLKGKNKGLTADYLTGKRKVALRSHSRKGSNKITLKKASEHNLQGFNVTIPLNCLTVVSGVSGSGKSTLIGEILFRALKKHLGEPTPKRIGQHESLEGDLQSFDTSRICEPKSDWQIFSVQSGYLRQGL